MFFFFKNNKDNIQIIDKIFNICNIVIDIQCQPKANLFLDPCCALKYYPEVEACEKV